MSLFVFLALMLGLLAIAFAVSSLWQKSRTLALVLALGIPAAAAGLYFIKGEPAALDPANLAAPTTMEEAIVQLQRRIADHPDDVEAQVVLARAYMASGQFPKARDIYAGVLAKQPEQTDLAVEYAESLLRASADGRFPPEAVTRLQAAIAANPDNQRALFFMGMHHRQESRPLQAAAVWEKLLPQLESEAATALLAQINEARAEAGQPALPDAIADTSGIAIEVRIDPTLADLVRPGAVLFVFARAPGGSGPPLAAKRIALQQLPVTLRLSDADSPMPAARLSSQPTVEIVARLSQSGDAAAASGDLQADPVDAPTDGSAPVTLVLNRTVP